ncbi:hypothetical protein [Nocardia sp. SC052]|uniref:hypothetical protein n=1 Tax=Nocardia sichangensis TaxID=3385975 RepID=UPI0039A0D27A
MESAAELAVIHSARRIPERTVELLDIVARCALLTAEFLSTSDEAASRAYVNEMRSLAAHSAYVSTSRSIGSMAEEGLAELHDELLATVAAFRAASRACVAAIAR